MALLAASSCWVSRCHRRNSGPETCKDWLTVVRYGDGRTRSAKGKPMLSRAGVSICKAQLPQSLRGKRNRKSSSRGWLFVNRVRWVLCHRLDAEQRSKTAVIIPPRQASFCIHDFAAHKRRQSAWAEAQYLTKSRTRSLGGLYVRSKILKVFAGAIIVAVTGDWWGRFMLRSRTGGWSVSFDHALGSPAEALYGLEDRFRLYNPVSRRFSGQHLLYLGPIFRL